MEAPIVSDYAVRPLLPVAHLSASGDSYLERVKLEMGPAPNAAPPLPPTEPPPAPRPDAPLVAALRCVLNKHPDQARQVLEKDGRSDRELLLGLLRLAGSLSEGEIEGLSPEEVAVTLEHLHVLAQRLRPRASLQLERMCFCRRIESFGQYDPLPISHAFQAGSAGRPGERVQVYVEVRNFDSAARQNHFETKLNSALEIIDEQRRRVVVMNLGTCTDVSQTPRQDYFLNFQFHVPAGMPPGLYTLWVTVKDETPAGPGHKVRVARQSLDFRVGPPGPR
jgi:hypothetical protein